MADRTKNRSDRYQYVLVESPCSPEMMAEVADADGFSGILSPQTKEEVAELRSMTAKLRFFVPVLRRQS